mgnify:CR=1 FL=1
MCPACYLNGHSALAPLALEAVPAALASGRPAAAWTAAAVSHARQPAAGHEAFRSSSQEGARTCSGRLFPAQSQV